MATGLVSHLLFRNAKHIRKTGKASPRRVTSNNHAPPRTSIPDNHG